MPNAAGVNDIGRVISAIAVVPGQTETSQYRRAVKLVFREAEDILVIILADRASIVGQHAQPVRESALVSNLSRLVVRSSTGSQIILILGEVGEGQIRRHSRAWRKDDIRDVAFLAIQ